MIKKLFTRKRSKSIRWLSLPLYIVPLILFLIAATCIFFISRNQLTETGQITAEKFSAQASSVLNELKFANDALLEDEQLISMITQDSITRSNERTVSSRIFNQLRQCAYVQSAYAISKQQDRIYSPNAQYSFRSLNSLLKLHSITLDIPDGQDIDAIPEGWSVPANNHASPYYVSHIRENDQVKATIIVILNKSYLFRTLFSTNSNYCAVYNDDFVLTSQLTNYPVIDHTSTEGIEKLVGEPVEVFKVESGDYTFLTALAKSTFYKPLYLIIWITAGYFAIVLILGTILTAISNNKEKAMFDSLITGLPNPVNSDASVQTLFASIKVALENYKEEHLAFSEQIKYQNLRKLVVGNLGPVNRDILEESGIALDVFGYYVIQFRITDEGIVDSSHRTDLTSIILETILNNYADGKYRAVCFPEDKDRGIILSIVSVFDETLSAEMLLKLIRDTRTIATKDYGTTFVAFVSNLANNISRIPFAYEQTIKVARFVHIIDSDVKLISTDQLDKAPSTLLHGEFLKQLQVLTNTILLGKFDIVGNMVDSILAEYVTPITKNYELAINRVNCISTIFCEAPLNDWLDTSQIEHFRSLISHADSAASLSNSIHKLLDALTERSEHSGIVSKAISYINDQISNDILSVPEIAEAAGVSVQHLARLFRNEYQMTTVEYINNTRISRAKELLTTTDMSITEIAEKTGYGNNVTFMRNFRKYVDCTPSEYKRKFKMS